MRAAQPYTTTATSATDGGGGGGGRDDGGSRGGSSRSESATVTQSRRPVEVAAPAAQLTMTQSACRYGNMSNLC